MITFVIINIVLIIQPRIALFNLNNIQISPRATLVEVWYFYYIWLNCWWYGGSCWLRWRSLCLKSSSIAKDDLFDDNLLTSFSECFSRSDAVVSKKNRSDAIVSSKKGTQEDSHWWEKSGMQKAVNAVNAFVLLFCTVVIIFGLCTSIDCTAVLSFWLYMSIEQRFCTCVSSLAVH